MHDVLDDQPDPGPITVAVLGAGNVGRTLAAGWTRAGHAVLLGSRDPGSDRIAAAVSETGAAQAMTHADAARAADVAVVAVPGEQVPGLIAELDGALDGRTAVDSTNLLAPGVPVMHHVDALAGAGAVVFRAFNTTGWEQMAQPMFGPPRADLPYAGPDVPARATVHHLVGALGFRPVWLGAGPDALASTDALARLWFQLALGRGWGRRLGLRLLSATDDEATDDEPAARQAGEI